MHGVGASSKSRGLRRFFRSSTPVPITFSAPVGVTRVYTAPIVIPSDVSSVVLRGANRTFAAGVGTDATIDFASYASNGSDSPAGSPLTTLLAKTLPGNGTVGTLGTMKVAPGSDKRAVLEFSFPNPSFSSVFATLNFGQYAEGASDVTTIPAFTGANTGPVFWLWLEYLTAKRKIVILGDSIAVGFNTDWKYAAWNVLATSHDIAVCIEGAVQYGSYQNFEPVSHPALFDMLVDIIPGNDVVIPLGTNDLAYADLTTMENAAKALFAYVRKFAPRSLRTWTVAPVAGYPGTDTIRLAFNADLLANQRAWGLDGVYDAAASRLAAVPGLADDVNPLVIYSGFDSGDGSHPNATGQAVIANAWAASLAL